MTANLIDDSAVQPVAAETGRYSATLSPEWAVWGPSGGYVAAIALRAAMAHSRLARPASFHCHFLALGEFGPVELSVMSLGGGYITFDLPIKPLVQLGHRHGVPVYPCLSQSGLLYRPPRGKSTKQPVAAWFGAAARLWHDEADGIYTFNLFPGPGPDSDRTYARKVLSMIGSPKMLAKATKMHAISDAGSWMPSHYWAKDAADFSKALPLSLKAGEYGRTSLYVPEDLSGAGFEVMAELRVDFTGLPAGSTPEILFGSANFGPTKGGQEVGAARRYVCPVPLQAIRQGPNRVMVKTKQDGAKLVGAELWIRR